MRIYELEAYVKGERVSFTKKFASRDQAIEYLFAYLGKQFIFNCELKEEYPLSSKHDVHYVLSNEDSFTVRSFAA